MVLKEYYINEGAKKMQVGSVETTKNPLIAPANASSHGQEHAAPVREVEASTPSRALISQMVDDMQNYIKQMNVSLQFSTYGAHGEKIAVTVADKETGEVIREIPSEELRDLYVKMSEVAGIIFNREA
jgi:flagellar protein FlaG